MLKQLQIRLIDQVKKRKTSKRVIEGLVNMGLIAIYPLTVIVGLITIFFAALLSFYQKIFRKKMNIEVAENIKSWSIMTQRNNLKILSQYVGEVRFGPVFLKLKAEPAIPFLDSKIFGDWVFYQNDILFLQKWNPTNKPDTDLIAIDTFTFEIKVLQQNIPSVLWNIAKAEEGKLQLECDTGHEILRYTIS